MALARTGFKRKTLDEVKATQAAKRHKMPQVKSKAKKRTKPRIKQKTQAQLKKQLDTIFSIYIRRAHPAKCYTCGRTETSLQCGHFISRSYLATRFHEDNCRPQCVGCNIFGNGKPLDFEEHLKKDLGDEYVENLKKLRHTTVKYDRQWYEEKIAHYSVLVKEL